MRRWQNRAFAEQKPLYRAQTTLGWSVARNITDRAGREGVSRGSMREVLDPITNLCIGYQMIGASELRGDQDLPSLPSSASISLFEMEVNAGLLGQSRTEGLTEEKRLELAARRRRRPGDGDVATGGYFTPEDIVERVQAKVLAFRRGVTGDKGDILRVWPKGRTLRDLREAEAPAL